MAFVQSEHKLSQSEFELNSVNSFSALLTLKPYRSSKNMAK